MIEERITQVIQSMDKGDIKECRFDKICPALIESVCDDNNWEFEMDDGYDGWEVGWCATIRTENATISVGGSMYYGTIHLFIQ